MELKSIAHQQDNTQKKGIRIGLQLRGMWQALLQENSTKWQIFIRCHVRGL